MVMAAVLTTKLAMVTVVMVLATKLETAMEMVTKPETATRLAMVMAAVTATAIRPAMAMVPTIKLEMVTAMAMEVVSNPSVHRSPIRGLTDTSQVTRITAMETPHPAIS